MAQLRIAIARTPTCPGCRSDGFDDWWHDPSTRSPGGPVVDIEADLTCDCGTRFHVTRYRDGEVHSCA